MPNFEVFQRPRLGPADHPTVTISQTGMTLNGPAVEQIGKPRTVELLYDRDERIVGIRPAADPESLTAFALTTIRSIGGGGKVTAQRFLTHFGIDTSRRRYAARVEDGVLCVDLAAESVPLSGNGQPIHVCPPQGLAEVPAGKVEGR